jgi:uncharacterized protein (DUF3084 family)
MVKTLVQPLNLVFTNPIRALGIPLVALALSAGLAGCALFPPSALEESRERVHDLEAERDFLRQQNEARDKEVARLQLEALEQNARIRELEAQLQKRDQDLAETRARLQRIDTRTQALTGPAQAAAAIAEAEAAFHVAAIQGEIDPAAEPAREIRRLLQAGTAAYEAGDYARAADLGDQVMRRLSKTVTAHLPEKTQSVNYPERPLANPVVFRVRVNSHVRRGPGISFAVRAVLPAGSDVTGLATRGQWVKIRSMGNVQGWIYRKLLAVPV